MINNNLKVVQLVASDTGGAFRAAERINAALIKNNVESNILVLIKKNTISETSACFNNRMSVNLFKLTRKLEAMKNKKYRISGKGYISSLSVNLLNNKLVRDADIIHIHWVNDGMLSLKGIEKILKSGKPVVWTMHDMYPFTAICYYDNGCYGYETGCNNCPFFENEKYKQHIHSIHTYKRKIYSEGNISFVGCSKWITECAKKSTICKDHLVVNIPNPINTDIFCPLVDNGDKMDQHIGKKSILFGAMSATSDERKGYKYLVKSLELLDNHYELIIFGKQDKLDENVKLDYTCLGQISEDSKLAAIYSKADVFVAPSIQENLSNAVMESLACGTPVVAFDIGGMSDMIQHKVNGYLAKPFDYQDLKQGIEWAANNKSIISTGCRESVLKKYSMDRIGELYRNLYCSILK